MGAPKIHSLLVHSSEASFFTSGTEPEMLSSQLPCECADNVSKLLSHHTLTTYLHFSLLSRSLLSNSRISSRFNLKTFVLVGLKFSFEILPKMGAVSHLMENPYCVICKSSKTVAQPAKRDAITSVWPNGKTVYVREFSN